jgi:phosphate transport system substrate-binding protein
MKILYRLKNTMTGWLLLVSVYFLSCKSYKEQERELPDTPWRGVINVSADESFKPVVDELVKVYESNRPGTKFNVIYKPEAECLNDLFTDSIRMVIATRGHTEFEKNKMVDSVGVPPSSLVVAKDAIAVIVHPSSPDSLFTMDELKKIITGKFSKKLIPVFDGVKATSTVRFIIDSVLLGAALSPEAVAATSSKGVIDYIAKTPHAVGFIGISWIGNREDPDQLSYLKEVKMAGIESPYFTGQFAKAYQQDIYTGNYPLVRDLVYILKEKHKGLGYGLAGFMRGDIGQLIFKRAYLVPELKNFGTRPVRLKE